MNSKKDYKAIAKIINQQIRLQQKMDNSGAVQALYDVAHALCLHFQITNPRFNDLKFMQACGAADQ